MKYSGSCSKACKFKSGVPRMSEGMSEIEIPLESSDLSKHFYKFRARTVEDLPGSS